MMHTSSDSDSTTRTAARALALLVPILWVPFAGAAEDASLEETLETLSADAAAAYVSPISSAFGANLNSGWFRRAPKATKLGFNFEAGMVLMGSFFPKDANHFSVDGQFKLSESEAAFLLDEYETQQGFTLPQAIRDELLEQITSQYSDVGISGATVVGAADRFPDHRLPGRHLHGLRCGLRRARGRRETACGSVSVTWRTCPCCLCPCPSSAWARYMAPSSPCVGCLPWNSARSWATTRYSGFGIQHNPAVWFDQKLPVDVALSFFTQTMKVGDLFDCKATAFGVSASKQWGWRFLNVTPYAGILLESAEMEVSYLLQVPVPESALYPDGIYTEPINISLESENNHGWCWAPTCGWAS
jgi:hypothetical protein